MKHTAILLMAILFTGTMNAASVGIKFRGSTLELNKEFTRTQAGTAYKSVRQEISGMTCSRTTPGYIWCHGDENTTKTSLINILAIQPNGTLTMTLNFSNIATGSRDDWEDICTGVYNSKNYVFVGAFGDNDLEYKDNYIIYYFEEPAITSGSKSIAVSSITFGYPDNQAHNTEALMYDNIEQKLYIVDKVKKGFCSVYSLPFNLNYGTTVQKLTKVCDLGIDKEKDFQLVTAADITPSGKYVIIKNNVSGETAYALIWDRQGTESLSTTLARQPKQIDAYLVEEQGESVAWLNDSLFYTTSDSKNNVPIYQYKRWTTPQQQDTTVTPPVTPPITPTGDSTQCGMIIRADITGKNSATISGTIGGTADVNLSAKDQGGKLDKNKYLGITLTSGMFHAGDTVTITMSAAADLEHVIIYADKDRQTIIYEDTTTYGGTTVTFVLTSNTQSIYLSRPDASGWNPTISSIQVNRPENKEATGTQEQMDKHIRAQKIIINGQLLVRYGNELFDVQGQKK